jgi:hypothetical protein
MFSAGVDLHSLQRECIGRARNKWFEQLKHGTMRIIVQVNAHLLPYFLRNLLFITALDGKPFICFQLLRSRAHGLLQSLEYLDLSNLDIGE